jgi:hypothetical protein
VREPREQRERREEGGRAYTNFFRLRPLSYPQTNVILIAFSVEEGIEGGGRREGKGEAEGGAEGTEEGELVALSKYI